MGRKGRTRLVGLGEREDEGMAEETLSDKGERERKSREKAGRRTARIHQVPVLSWKAWETGAGPV